jgi:pyruvate/2-oxoglutarate/acetoin dehydrogenase E1 component
MSEAITAAAENMTALQAINLALHDALEADENVILFGEDVGDKEGGGVVEVTKGLSSKFGDKRVRSTPISEQAIIGAAIGASLAGMKPIAEIMLMNFTTVAMDMIVNHAAKIRFMSGGQTHVPITIRMMTGAGFANGGQHSDFLEAWFAHTPGLKVVIPSNPVDAYGLLRSCIDDPDPCIFVEPLGIYWVPGPSPERGSYVPLGKAKVVQDGTDVTVITYGRQVNDVISALADIEDKVSVEVVDLRTIAPFDEETVLASVGKTGRAVIVHEAVKNFGVGAEISSRIQEALFGQLKSAVARVGGKFSPVPFSQPLEAAFMPTADEIKAAVLGTLG